MGFYAIKGVLVATSSAPKHGLGPTAYFDSRMTPDQFVALLGQRFSQQGGDHLFRFVSHTFLVSQGGLFHDLLIELSIFSQFNLV